MIGRISGQLISKQPPMVLVDAHGVGYELEAPMSTFYKLPATGEAVSLITQLIVREDAQLLFGFATNAERDLFRALIKVSGVGPKMALAILSGMGADDFWQCVRDGETARLTRLPGVGKKTAERLGLELKDKSAGKGEGAIGNSQGPAAGASDEAARALEALGYRPAEAQKLIKAVADEHEDAESMIRAALKRAVR
ncbi:MAG: Holliday junction branch migration protein RuvA [Panacagrimonas sp.]